MPVLSPHRSSASALSGSYRSTFSSSAIDRPYFSSSSYSPRITSYSERYTTRTYTDADGRRLYSRSGSITEDGITTRFREDSRENSVSRRDSLSRDSGIGSIRENSTVSDYTTTGGGGSSRRDSSVDPSSRLTAINVLDSVAELRNKYSPANYVPACMRSRQDNISRSKSINDIGLPPMVESTKKKTSSAAITNGKVTTTTTSTTTHELNYNNSVANSNNTNNDDDNNHDLLYHHRQLEDDNDDNGNRASVADLRKKFNVEDARMPYRPSSKTAAPPLEIEGVAVRISENLFKRQDPKQRRSERLSSLSKSQQQRGDVIKSQANGQHVDAKSEVKDGGVNNGTFGQRQQQEEEDNNSSSSSSTSSNGSTRSAGSRVNNFASYIPSRDYQKGAGDDEDKEVNNAVGLTNGEVINNGGEDGGVGGGGGPEVRLENGVTGKKFNDISTTSPKLSVASSSRSAVSPSPSSSLNSSNSNSLSRRSSDRDSLSNSSTGTTTTTVNNSTAIRGGGAVCYNNEPEGSSLAIYDNGTSNSSSTTTSTNSLSSSKPCGRTGTTINSSAGKVLGLNGLKNIGNTCFMNSVIQCLSNTKLILEYVIKDGYVRDINTSISSMKGALIRAFAEVIKELWSEDAADRVVNTTSLKSQIQRFAPRFIGYAQQDAQEFLRYLLEGLHEDVNRVTEKPKPIHTEIDEKLSDNEKSAEAWGRYLRMDNSKIVEHFVGQFKSTLKCTHCGHCSVTFDPFWDLSLPIPQRAGQVRLSQCLDSFTREETLDGDEKPTCSKCKERRKCTKSFTIQKFPKILVIHLKRFSLAERFRGKLTVTVDFPLEGLDMSQYAAANVTPCRYNLYAISNHSGTTYSGHYTAYCRHPYAKTWHEYNDSRVSSISSKSIVSGEAYVLFYEQEGQRSHL